MRVPEPYELLLLAGAAARVTTLITEDAVLDTPRDRVTEWAVKRDHEKLTYFITCPWCVGWWVSLAAWASWQAWPGATLILAALCAVAMIASFVSSRA